ncbi:MAG: hypothetical protein JWM68_3478, partial [Verrucomicrobiales bacterium]|nr:hypothetical protein [Verrucomicrobiales bacterium]
KSQEADLKATIEAALPKLAQLLNNPQLAISSGAFKFNGTVKQKAATQTIAGDLLVDRFTGHYSTYSFNDFIAAIQADIEKQNDLLQIRKLNGDLKSGSAAGGTFTVSGNLDSKKMVGEFAVNLKDLNENTLRTFLQPSLGDKKLVSILINGNATAQLKSTNDFSTKADFVVTNLVVLDPKKGQADAPLAVHFTADAGMEKDVLNLRQIQLGLTPTSRGKNQLLIKGLVNRTDTNAMKGNLTISADSIDVTQYYDLYAGKAEKEKAKAQGPAGTSGGAATAPAKDQNKEPDAMNLGIGEFDLNVSIGQFYLREIAITNLQAVGKVVGNKVNLNPVQLTINGAPVKANIDLNLGVAGYAYNVAVSANRIPLEPIANSFIPDKRGQYKGDILANVQIKGAGITGINLKKNLSGNVNFSYTNANIKLAPDGKIGFLIKGISFLLRMPSLLESPLNYVDAQIDLGNGQINLKKGEIVSPAFKADTAGLIPIADVFMNSPLNKLPVDFYLSRNLAEKSGLMPANAPADAPYVLLPNFVKLIGTIGNPDTEKNYLNLTGAGLKSAGSLIGGKTGDVLKGVGGAAGGVIQGVGGLFNGGQKTNSPAGTNQPAPANPVNDILNIFKKKK